jgi:hypothetical protein
LSSLVSKECWIDLVFGLKLANPFDNQIIIFRLRFYGALRPQLSDTCGSNPGHQDVVRFCRHQNRFVSLRWNAQTQFRKRYLAEFHLQIRNKSRFTTSCFGFINFIY